MFTTAEAIEAIRALLSGVYDSEQLLKAGDLEEDSDEVIMRILDNTIIECAKCHWEGKYDDLNVLCCPNCGAQYKPARIGKTEDNYEAYLNDLYEEIEYEDVMNKFIYLTNVNRGKSITSEVLYSFYGNGSIGTMLREYDSIAFTTGFNDWNP